MQEKASIGTSKLRKRKRRWAFGVLAILGAYVLSYAVLSIQGQHVFCQTGKLRWNGTLAVSDIAHWHPRGIWWEPFLDVTGHDGYRADIGGWLYSPLIWIDRRWIHKTEVILNPEAFRTSR